MLFLIASLSAIPCRRRRFTCRVDCGHSALHLAGAWRPIQVAVEGFAKLL